ncbi:unnamed protein product [Clonostachys solani]|uniref:Zn(2)-C6 fungal-type domain-containing protein n=1 Tax=Clonostachys solani TaxID=160281 RepID=A0A9N9W4Z9_9HYPO|nr:unnamed protein product [Clonostachys solani]
MDIGVGLWWNAPMTLRITELRRKTTLVARDQSLALNMLYPDSAEVHKSRASESSARRHNIRKGTRSCWDCKRRKVRCVFASPHDTVCNNCRRRGAVCAGQELPEELAPPRDQQIGDRIARVEGLVQDLAKQVDVLTGTIISAQGQPMRSLHDAPNPSHGSDEVQGADRGFHEVCDARKHLHTMI